MRDYTYLRWRASLPVRASRRQSVGIVAGGKLDIENYKDLYWVPSGGGGNFCVVIGTRGMPRCCWNIEDCVSRSVVGVGVCFTGPLRELGLPYIPTI